MKLGDYTLPNDTVIIPDIYSIHMDPDLWENPEEFRPERFIDVEGKIQRPAHFIPFSIGEKCYSVKLILIRLQIIAFLSNLLDFW